MKLPLSEIKTNCEKCSFAIFDENNQTGCAANRLGKFQALDKAVQHSEDDKSWFLLKRFCNMYREGEASIDEAYNKIKCKFGVVIFDHHDEVSLDTAIQSCKNIEYDKSRFFVVISSKHYKIFGRKFNQINELKNIGIKGALITSFDDKAEISSIEHEAFSKLYGCTHLVKINHDQEVPKNFFDKINDSVNDKLETILMYEQNNVKCIPFWLVNNTYLEYNNYDLMSDDIKKESIKKSMYKKYEE